MGNEHEKEPKRVTYFVNGEEQHTSEHKLTVGTILADAGFEPPTDYRLVRDNGNHAFDDPGQEVPVHDGERFTALFKGTTPTSC